MTLSNQIENLLQFDPLAEAESVTGLSYKESEETSALGVLLHMAHSKAKDKALQETGDTCYSNTLAQQIAVFEGMGFELVYSGKVEGTDDSFYIYWRDGILLFFDTFRGKLNSGNAYFNYVSNDDWFFMPGFSGSCVEYNSTVVKVGSIDVREGFRHRIESLEKKGTFLSNWVEIPFLWLLHHQDTKVEGYSYDDINKLRISLLPKKVQHAMGFVA